MAVAVGNAQVSDIVKDTIRLDELVITKYSSSNYRIRDIARRGKCYAPDNLSDASEIISLVDNLPAGELNSIRFYFNEMFDAYKRLPQNVTDRDFELLLYRVNDNNTPGERLVHETMLLRLKKSHTGGVVINISALGIKSPDRLFIGLRLLGERGKNDFYVDCLCNGYDKYLTLFRDSASKDWNRRWACAALKIDVSVAVKK
ncbi:hypothetical protein [Flavobacterium cyanobacteriorum]|nr:hypothetical protein [Flavobacterium cyanobacteriorum]